MYDRLSAAFPEAEFLVPDFRTPGRGGQLTGELDLVKNAMSYSRFQGLLRSLMALHPLCLPLEDARQYTTYSLRRKLPSVADRLQLPPERRAEIGDWLDVLPDGTGGWKAPREPMFVRYSAARLETSASTRRVCLHAMAHATDDESVRQAEDPQALYKQVLGPDWGRRLLEPGLSPETSSSSSSTSESSSSSDSASVDSEVSDCSVASHSAVHWILPAGADSRLHLCRFDPGEEDDLMPICRHTPFRFGAQRGQGLVNAAQTGRQWSPRCRRRLLERCGDDCLACESD